MRAQLRSAQTACALSFSEGSAAPAHATFERPNALVAVVLYPMNAYHATGTAVSLGARPCSDVRAAASKRAADLRACASQNCANRVHSLSLGRKRSTHACDVRTPRRPGWSLFIPYESLLRQRVQPSPSVHGCAPTC